MREYGRIRVSENPYSRIFYVVHGPNELNPDDSGIALPDFPSRTTLTLHNISETTLFP